MESLKIVGLCILSSIIYGILHDLVTANLCVEYFSVFHPKIFNTDNPWLLALGWGFVATWWMGLLLSPFIAVAARSGALPQLKWRDLIRPLAILLLSSYTVAFIAGIVGYQIGTIPGWVLKQAPQVVEAHFTPAKEHLFTADLYAHNASYLTTGLGAFILCFLLIRHRIKLYRPLLGAPPPQFWT